MEELFLLPSAGNIALHLHSHALLRRLLLFLFRPHLFPRFTQFGVHPLGYFSSSRSNFSKAKSQFLQVPADPGGRQDVGKLP